MRFILTEAMTVSKIFLDEETGKFYRIKGDTFVEIPAPPKPDEDDDDDEYNPDVDYGEQNKQAEKKPTEIDEFSFNDDEEEKEEEEEDEIGDDEEEDETKRKGVIIHDRITGKDFVWNKKKQQYVPFR